MVPSYRPCRGTSPSAAQPHARRAAEASPPAEVVGAREPAPRRLNFLVVPAATTAGASPRTLRVHCDGRVTPEKFSSARRRAFRSAESRCRSARPPPCTRWHRRTRRGCRRAPAPPAARLAPGARNRRSRTRGRARRRRLRPRWSGESTSSPCCSVARATRSQMRRATISEPARSVCGISSSTRSAPCCTG